MRLTHLNIGSNLGDRYGNIMAAVDALKSALAKCGDPEAAATIRVSSPVESEPWGFSSPNFFVNAGVNLVTTLEPYALLEATQMAEKTLSSASHRHTDGSYADRIVDIDIIWMEGISLNSPHLTLPHPRALQRSFVTIPFAQLNPTLDTTRLLFNKHSNKHS
ncbi:MAG: 2-amino-4-hydroxy-6-hydroxymethyldihydropteridine diphosphokinase [Muribaculaceae bacterium]|nr:2-amino-4-hydroxy-6-hydroxymethyldihydropteridine diphosphokinase [Muribaculaceae bacterium]